MHAQSVAPLPYADADAATLIGIWEESARGLLAAAEEAGPDQWNDPTPCPGWSVGDVVAHVCSIDRFLLGRTDPEHVPDYESLPHVQRGLSRITEIPVDLRRSRSRDEVLAEFGDTITARAAALVAGPQDLTAPTMGVFGKPLPLDTVLRMRIFDTWVHEQDVRVAADRPGGLSGPPAWISAASMVTGAAFVWARRVAAAEGSAAALIVTGPGLHFDVQVGIVDGRGVIVTEAEPVTTLTLPFPELVALCAGRVPADSGPARATITGDLGLGESLVTQLNVSP